ncbi:MAG: glycoside hydrolase family 108 protein [bacterium]
MEYQLNKVKDFLKNVVIIKEGFYSNHPRDYGGETVFGISRRYNPNWEGWKIFDSNRNNLDKVKEQLKELAVDFYLEKYFTPFKEMYNKLPKSSLFLLDWYINSGVNAIKRLQRILGVSEDGIIGKITLNKAFNFNDLELFNLLVLERMKFYLEIVINDSSQEIFLIGWLNRVYLVSKEIMYDKW